MDINGFFLLIAQAMDMQAEETGKNRLSVTTVKLAQLAKVFASHSSWSALNDESSDFVRYL